MTDPKRPDERDQPTPGADRGTARSAQRASDAGEAADRRAGVDDDARFDAAWRSQSREEPPPALDAALRAAARREVGARVKPATVPEATRPERWWFPLAAAATIGAIAIGLLQVVTPDRMGSPGGDARSVSDVPPGAKSVEMPGEGPTQRLPSQTTPAPASAATATVTPAPVPAPAPAPTTTTTAMAPVTPAPTTTAMAGMATKAEPDGASRVTPSAPSSAKVEAQAPARVAADVPSGVTPPPPSTPTATSAEGARRNDTPQPFPALAGKPSGEPAPRVADSPGAAPAAVPAPPAAALRAPIVAPFAAPPASAPTAAPPPAPMAKLGSAREQSDRAVAPRAADAAEGAAGASRARGEIVQRAAELPVPEWIALIRRLRDEGKYADVERELKAFRVAHPDHPTLLPPDLRDWRMPP